MVSPAPFPWLAGTQALTWPSWPKAAAHWGMAAAAGTAADEVAAYAAEEMASPATAATATAISRRTVVAWYFMTVPVLQWGLFTDHLCPSDVDEQRSVGQRGIYWHDRVFSLPPAVRLLNKAVASRH